VFRPTVDLNADGMTDDTFLSSTGQWQMLQSTGSAFTTVTWASFASTSAATWPANFVQRGVKANYQYDNEGRLVTLTYQKLGAGTSLASYVYGFDLANRAGIVTCPFQRRTREDHIRGQDAGRGLLSTISRESSSTVRTTGCMATWLPVRVASRIGCRQTWCPLQHGSGACRRACLLADCKTATRRVA
jgi:hypothetical protein